MFVVCVFGARGVDTRIAGSEDAEEEEEGAGDGKGVDDGGVDGVLLDLAGSVTDGKSNQSDRQARSYLCLERICDQVQKLVRTAGISARRETMVGAHVRIDKWKASEETKAQR
jgi:hypothetical protein